VSASRSGIRLALLVLCALLALLWIWFVPRASESAPQPLGFHTWDFHNYFMPRFSYGNEELLAGRLPLWNRLEFAGLPFLATVQPSALYPPKIVAFALLPSDAAMSGFVIAHQLLLAVGSLLFLRSQGVGAFGCFAGAAFLVFNSTIFHQNHHPNLTACVAWVPLIFWLADRVARSARMAPIAALALAIALQLLAGYPEQPLETALLLGVTAIALLVQGRWPAPARTLVRLAAAYLLGAALAGLQLAPMLELAASSARGAAASFFVETASKTALGTQVGLLLVQFTLFWFLPGIIAFAFAGALRRSAVAPLVSAAFCAVMLLGGWQIVRALPGLSGIRHGLVWLPTSQITLAWLVGIGADALLRSDAGRAGRFALAAASVLWAGICALALLGGAAKVEGLIGPEHGGTLTFALGAPGAALLAAAALSARARAPLALAATGLLLLAQLAAFPMDHTAGPLRRYDSPDRIHALLPATANTIEGRAFSFEDLRWGATFYERVESPFGLETTLPPARARALVARFGLLPNFSKVDWPLLSSAEGFLDALDVQYVVVPFGAPVAFRADEWSDAWGRRGLHLVLRNQRRPGRAWVAYGANVVASEQAALDRLLAPDFDPTREVILESTPRARYAAPSEAPASTPASARVPSPTRLEVTAELPRPGLLVVSEAWYPGWRAWVDGAPAAILPADYLLRGVELDAGRHEVRFEYRPRSLAVGAALSLAGVLTVLGLVLADRRRARS
jgi:hypothetical protein